MAGLESSTENIRSRHELAIFIDCLPARFRGPEAWENANLECFLTALSAWVNDMDGYFLNRSEVVPEAPSWRFVAQMLLAARVYE